MGKDIIRSIPANEFTIKKKVEETGCSLFAGTIWLDRRLLPEFERLRRRVQGRVGRDPIHAARQILRLDHAESSKGIDHHAQVGTGVRSPPSNESQRSDTRLPHEQKALEFDFTGA